MEFAAAVSVRHRHAEDTGLFHRPGNLFDEEMFDGEENAIVDFKYSSSPRLTWWFDHHQSAFLTPADEAHFRADHSGKKFLDASRKSCTEFIAAVARAKFGFDDGPLGDLVHWAHVIDGALYESAAQCVELREPPLQLMQVIEADAGETFSEQIIRDLATRPLDEVATSPEVQQRFGPILQRHRETLEAIRGKATYKDGVVQFLLRGADARSATHEDFGRLKPLGAPPAPPQYRHDL